METTDTSLSSLVINKLTKQQYTELKESGEVSDNELYFYTDEQYTSQEVNSLLVNKQDKLTAGTDISIENGVISFTGDSNCKIESIKVNGESTTIDNKVVNISVPEEAKDISYSNEQYPELLTLQDAMDKLLYVKPTVTISGGGRYEIGSTVNSVTLNWSANKKLQTQSINQGIGELSSELRTYTYTTPITSSTTFTITVSDGKNNAQSSTSVSFYNNIYWGVSTSDNLSNESIKLLSKEFSTTRKQTRTFDCTGGKYFYFAIPQSFCNGISFKVGGLSFSDMQESTIDFTNNSGYTSKYNIYRVAGIQTGSNISVEVL